MRKIINPYIGLEGYDCFGCAPENPLGLHMEFYEDGDDIVSFWNPSQHYQGWRGVMHGGILATLIDETGGWVIARKLQTTGMTTSLQLHYRHAVTANDPQLTIRAHIKEQRHGMVTLEATLESSQGEVCVTAEAVYYTFDKQQAREMGFTRCDVEDEQLLSF